MDHHGPRHLSDQTIAASPKLSEEKEGDIPQANGRTQVAGMAAVLDHKINVLHAQSPSSTVTA
jgi:hypothetical protein